jgi:hypothetical protein
MEILLPISEHVRCYEDRHTILNWELKLMLPSCYQEHQSHLSRREEFVVHFDLLRILDLLLSRNFLSIAPNQLCRTEFDPTRG